MGIVKFEETLCLLQNVSIELHVYIHLAFAYTFFRFSFVGLMQLRLKALKETSTKRYIVWNIILPRRKTV